MEKAFLSVFIQEKRKLEGRWEKDMLAVSEARAIPDDSRASFVLLPRTSGNAFFSAITASLNHVFYSQNTPGFSVSALISA